MDVVLIVFVYNMYFLSWLVPNSPYVDNTSNLRAQSVNCTCKKVYVRWPNRYVWYFNNNLMKKCIMLERNSDSVFSYFLLNGFVFLPPQVERFILAPKYTPKNIKDIAFQMQSLGLLSPWMQLHINRSSCILYGTLKLHPQLWTRKSLSSLNTK